MTPDTLQGALIPDTLQGALIPDTLQGALILSIIDFFLSFAIIGGIGIVLALFPKLNQLGEVSDQDLKAGH